MSKFAELSDSVYEQLQEMVSPDETVNAAIIQLLERNGSPKQPKSPPRKPATQKLSFGLDDIPDLTHARILNANLDGSQLHVTKWNHLRDEMIDIALSRNLNLVKLSSLHIVKGRKIDEGFHHHPNWGFSVQGQSSKNCWQTCVDLCLLMNVSLVLNIQWRLKNGAAHPGEKAELHVP